MTSLKYFVKPPESASILLERLCYAFDEDRNVKWVPVPDGKPGEKMQDFWDYYKKKVLNDKLRLKESTTLKRRISDLFLRDVWKN